MNKYKQPVSFGFTLAVLAFFLLAGYSVSKAQPSFTLKQAIEYAQKNNLNVLNAELDVKMANAQKNEVTGIGFPQISGNVDVKDFVEIPTSLIPAEVFGGPAGSFIPVQFGTKYNVTAGVQVSQLVFSSDYIVGLQASKTFMELSNKSLKRTQIEITAQVTKAYMAVLVNQKRLELFENNIRQLETLRNELEILYNTGFAEKLELDRIKVNYNNLLSEKEKFQRIQGITETMLKFQMGFDVSQPIVVADKLEDYSNQPAELGQPAKNMVANRIEYSLLQSQNKINELDLRRYRLGYLPTLAAYGSLNAMAMRNEFDVLSGIRWFPTAVIGATLNVPIFDGLQTNFRIQKAKLNLEKSKNDLKSFENASLMEMSNAYTSYKNAQATLMLQQSNIELAQSVFDSTLKKYKQGLGSNLEVVSAETALKESQINYYNSLFELLVAKVDYEKASGLIK
jgi:outer membrane protein